MVDVNDRVLVNGLELGLTIPVSDVVGSVVGINRVTRRIKMVIIL